MFRMIRKGWAAAATRFRSFIRPSRGRSTWRSVRRWAAKNKKALVIGGGIAAAGTAGYFIYNALDRADVSDLEPQEEALENGMGYAGFDDSVSAHKKFSSQLVDMLHRVSTAHAFGKDPLVINRLYIQLSVMFADYIQSIPDDEHEADTRRAVISLLRTGYLGLTVDAAVDDPTLLSYFSQNSDVDETAPMVEDALQAVLNLSGTERNEGYKLRSAI